MRLLIFFSVYLFALGKINAQLGVGDIAFVVYNTDGDDRWAFVVLEDIPVGETLNFTTTGWTGSAFYSNSEETLSVTTGSVIPSGTIVNVSGTTFSPSIGSVSGVKLTPFAGDQIICYQGSIASPTFIAAINGDYNALDYDAATGWNTGSVEGNTTSSALPTGLTNGATALSLFPGVSEIDNARYNCTLTSGTKVELLSAINNKDNWESSNTTPFDACTGSFTVNATASTAPEINVRQSMTDVLNNDTYPFGNVQIGDNKEVEFTIENTGDGALDIFSVIPTGTGFSISSAISVDPIPASGSATFTVRFEPSGTSQTIGNVTIANDDEDEGSYVINFTSTVSPASLDLKVYLEGPLAGTTMTTFINNDLPNNPVSVYGGILNETSAGIPSTAVDWVEIELRTGVLASTKTGTNRAGLLHSDGAITDVDGNTFTMGQVDGNSYYIVIHHRNHLSVMSANAVAPVSGKYSFDFTTTQANSYSGGADGAIQVGSVFAMVAGDQNSDGQVNSADLTNWRSQNGGAFNYASSTADFNLDGQVNAIDRNDYQQPNSGKSSQVPTN